MKKRSWVSVSIAIAFLIAFVLWTVAVRTVDVRPIGPQGSSVGFAALNRYVHELSGTHTFLYVLTDWLGFVPIGIALGFAVLGLVQWIKRKSILNVDRSILALGGFYAAVMAVYILFEIVKINYRPVLIDGLLEPSYPSSTTMLAMCVMPTAMMQCYERVKNRITKHIMTVAMGAFLALMVIGRLLSGVHWLTDIIGGALVSTGLVLLYRAFK